MGVSCAVSGDVWSDESEIDAVWVLEFAQMSHPYELGTLNCWH